MNTRSKKHVVDLGNSFSEKTRTRETTETTIKNILQAVEGEPLREKATRSSYYALKAEYRNYLLLKNLFLTQPTLEKAQVEAGFKGESQFKLRGVSFEDILEIQVRLSRNRIIDLIERLKPASQSCFKGDSFQIELQ